MSIRREMELGLHPEEELEKLQNDVKQMAERILHYRGTLPSQLKESFALLVSDQTTEEAADEIGFRSGTSNGDNQGNNSNSDPAEVAIVSACEVDDEQLKMKIQLLKRKASANVTAAPILLKRIKECISKIETLDSDRGRTINPAFWEDQTN